MSRFSLIIIRRLLPVAVLAAVTGVAHAQVVTVYDFGGSTFGVGRPQAQPRPTNVADIGVLESTPGLDVAVSTIQVGRVNGTTAGTIDIGFFLWGNVDLDAPVGTSIFSNLRGIFVFTRTITPDLFNLRSLTTINFSPGSLTLPGGSTFGYQMVYAQPGTINTSTAAYTPNTIGVGGFFTDQGTSGLGSSSNTFFSSNDTSGRVSAADETSLAPPDQAFSSVFLVVRGVLVPEPGTIGLLALGGVTFVGVRIRRTLRRE